jgi:hypothetical protein
MRALEIDEAQFLLVASALVADGQIARIAASAGALACHQQRLMRLVCRQVVVHQRSLKAQCRRNRSVCLDRHLLCPREPIENSIRLSLLFRARHSQQVPIISCRELIPET